MLSCSLNIAGTAYTYLRKVTSASFEKQIAAYTRYNATVADASEYYTSYANGNIRVNVCAINAFDSGSGGYVGTEIRIYIDGVQRANLVA